MDITADLPVPEDIPLTSTAFSSMDNQQQQVPSSYDAIFTQHQQQQQQQQPSNNFPSGQKRVRIDGNNNDDGGLAGDDETESTPLKSKRSRRKGKDKEAGMSENEEEVKKRKELNRLAAEKSRSKKREELSGLEKTVSNIQAENDRLRMQLDALLAAASSSNESSSLPNNDDNNNPSSSSPIAQPQAGPSTAIVTTETNQDSSSRSEDPTIPVSSALLPGAASLDLSHLTSLISEITTLQSLISHKELSLSSASPESEIARPSTAKQIEKQALLSTIETLNREKEEMDLERKILQREVDARKQLILIRRQVGIGGGHSGDGMGIGVGVGAGVGSGTVEAGGVSRALLEVRSWLDDALNGWKKTGTIPHSSSFSSSTDPNPNPSRSNRKRKALDGNPHDPSSLSDSSMIEHATHEQDEGPGEYEVEGQGSIGLSLQGAQVEMNGMEEQHADTERQEGDPQYHQHDEQQQQQHLDQDQMGMEVDPDDRHNEGEGEAAGGGSGQHDGVFDGMEGLDEHVDEEYAAMRGHSGLVM